MAEFSDLKKRIREFKLDNSDKKAIDIFVNGSFIVLGMWLVVFPGVTTVDFHTVTGVLAIYVGTRFLPR